MKKTDWTCIIFILILTATATTACRPLNEEDRLVNNNDVEPALTVTAAIASQSTTPTIDPTPSPPPLPTAIPTIPSEAANIQVGGSATGLQFAIPQSWRDLSGRLDVPRATNPLGLIVLLATNNNRTGESLLAGKQLLDGAFATGHIAHLDLPAGAPIAGLQALTAELAPVVVPLTDAAAVTSLPAGAGSGAFIDVRGDPLGFFGSNGSNLRTRIYLFFPADELSAASSQAFFLFSAPEQLWDTYSDSFADMASSIVLHNIDDGFAITGGDVNVQRELGQQELVNGRLDNGRKDIWTFRTEGGRYATINLKPEASDLDLILSVISPSGDSVTRVDNGYANDVEFAADLFLSETGLHVIEISEFFNNGGPYSLSLVLTDEPLFTSGGSINYGQGIQSDLLRNGQQVWTFTASAGKLVSIVLSPLDNDLDTILELFGPDGQQLLALDEGFSGDAEVVNGFEIPVTGEYSILVRSFAGNGGSYALALDEGSEETLNFYDAGDIVYGETRRETLRMNEAHAWFFNGRAGDQIRVQITPLNARLDPELWLLDPSVERLTTQDVFLEGEPETITFQLPQDGQYLVLVRDFHGESGDYEIALTADAVATPTVAGNLTYGDSVTAQFGPGQVTVWQFSGEDGDLIDINLMPATASTDLILSLEDPDGNVVLLQDNALADEDEVLTGFRLTADGRWRILIREFFGEGGSYNLTVDRTQ